MESKESRLSLPEKHRLLPLLRWVLMIALSYLVLFSGDAPVEISALCVVLFLGSNLALRRLPERAFYHPAFDLVLVVVDISLITITLIVCHGQGDLFFLFFFSVFLAALGERPALTAVGAAFAAGAYLSLLPASAWRDSGILLRVPFMFITALTYGYLGATARAARRRAGVAEEALSTLSREMRAPLREILSYSEMLRAGQLGALSPAQRARVTEINGRAVELLEAMVAQLHAAVETSPAMGGAGRLRHTRTTRQGGSEPRAN